MAELREIKHEKEKLKIIKLTAIPDNEMRHKIPFGLLQKCQGWFPLLVIILLCNLILEQLSCPGRSASDVMRSLMCFRAQNLDTPGLGFSLNTLRKRVV